MTILIFISVLILLVLIAIIEVEVKNQKIQNVLFYLVVFLFFGVILFTIYPYTKLPDIEKIQNYKEEILILQAKQSDIKDNNSEEYKKNKEKIKSLYEKYNKEATKYNEIIKEDEKKWFIFRWYPDKEKLKLYN